MHRRRVASGAALLLLVCLTCFLDTVAGAAARRTAPVGVVAMNQSFADPSYLHAGGRYFAYGTGGDGQGGLFPVASASSFQGPWTVLESAMPERPAWTGPNNKGRIGAWAPSVLAVGPSRYLLYFSANRAGTGEHCLGVAVAEQPAGPYVSTPAPFLCVSSAEAIDPFPLVVDGVPTVLYKVNWGQARFQIRSTTSSPDGLAAVGAPEVLLSRLTNVESPALLRRQGAWYLFVSTGSFVNCSYRTDVLRSDRLAAGSFRPVTRLLTTRAARRCGPGGADVRWDGGEVRSVFHAWVCPSGVDCRRGSAQDPDRYRAMLTTRLGWRAGVPFIP